MLRRVPPDLRAWGVALRRTVLVEGYVWYHAVVRLPAQRGLELGNRAVHVEIAVAHGVHRGVPTPSVGVQGPRRRVLDLPQLLDGGRLRPVDEVLDGQARN